MGIKELLEEGYKVYEVQFSGEVYVVAKDLGMATFIAEHDAEQEMYFSAYEVNWGNTKLLKRHANGSDIPWGEGNEEGYSMGDFATYLLEQKAVKEKKEEFDRLQGKLFPEDA